jgi:hypothetical protein
VVFFGTDGKVVMTPQSFEHSSTIKSMQIDSLSIFGPADDLVLRSPPGHEDRTVWAREGPAGAGPVHAVSACWWSRPRGVLARAVILTSW